MQKKKSVPVVAPEQSNKSCCGGSTSGKQKVSADKSGKQHLHIGKSDVKVKDVVGKKSGGCCGGH